MISKVRMSKWSISHRRKAPEAQRDLFCILQICQVPLQKAAFYLLNIKTITAQLHRKFSFWISFSNPSLEPYYFSSASITPSKFHHYKMYYHSENALGGIFIPCYGIMYSDVFKNHKLLCSQSGRHNLNINQPWCKLWVTLKFVNTFHNGTVLNPASSGSDFYYCTTRWVIVIASLLTQASTSLHGSRGPEAEKEHHGEQFRRWICADERLNPWGRHLTAVHELFRFRHSSPLL